MVSEIDHHKEGRNSNMSSPISVSAIEPSSSLEPIVLPRQTQKSRNGTWKVLPPSQKSKRTVNPIRAIVDPIVANIQSGEARGDGKDHISLALGDPTAAGNLPPCPVAISAVLGAVSSPPHAAGYVNACGLPAARLAVAKYHSSANQKVEADEVVIASGCSGALELALTALLDEDSVLLVPQPGFPLYQVIAESHGAKVVHYRLLSERKWECDLEHLQELMAEWGDRVRGVVVCNPSNPTGAVFSRAHLEDLVFFCETCHLPIVADEVYGDLTYGDNVFHPMADVAAFMGRRVPVITAGGIGKQFLLPGWRLGWTVFHDNVDGSLREVEAGAKRLAQVILGASHIPQTGVSALLEDDKTIHAWKKDLRDTLEQQGNFLCEQLRSLKGLDVIPPGGAMYTMVHLDVELFDESIQNDVDFSRLLLEEENVFVLPGSCFGASNVFRAVFCAPMSLLDEATARVSNFCKRHAL